MVLFLYNNSFYASRAIKWIIISSPVKIKFITLFLKFITLLVITFLILNSLWFVLLQYFLIKGSNIFSVANVFYYICPRGIIFNIFNHKNSFRPLGSVVFCKKFLYFDIITCLPTLTLGSWSLNLYQSQHILS